MDVTQPRPKGLPALAAVALVILGAALSVITWGNLEEQKRLIDQHVRMAARAILRGVESNLMRVMPMLGRMDPGVANERLADVLRETAESGGILFLGVYDTDGQLLLSSAPAEAQGTFEAPLDAAALADLAITGEWFGSMPLGGSTMLGYAARMRPGMARLCPGGSGQGMGPGPGRGPGAMAQGQGVMSGAGPGRGSGTIGPGLEFGPGQGRGPEAMVPGRDRARERGQGRMAGPSTGMDNTDPGSGPSAGGSDQSRESPGGVYFLVGMSLDEHYAQYLNSRNAALLQTGFVLGAAALMWLLLLAYMRRREQGRRLVRLESFHSRLLDSLPEGLVTVDASGMVTAANPAAKAILGPDLVGRAFAELPLPDCLAGGTEASSRACAWEQAEVGGRFLETLAAPLEGETMVLVRDRTQMRSLERDLEQSRHLAAVGRLAAGVAHEIRNPLSALRGFAQFFASKLKGRDPEESYATTMVVEADRLGRVVTDLLYLARPRPAEPAPVDMAGLVEELSRLLRFDLERAKAILEPRLELDTVPADPDGLKQALLNLILNSLAALPPEGGPVTVGARPAGGGAEVYVADRGRGMAEEERQRALEPFFTTRKEGSGLGLAIVHKIVRDHRGELAIESREGEGTTVRLYFRD